MTYEQIKEEYKRIYNKTIKSCWIADAKRDLHLPQRAAYNRIDINSPKHPCPNSEIKERIKRILIYKAS